LRPCCYGETAEEADQLLADHIESIFRPFNEYAFGSYAARAYIPLHENDSFKNREQIAWALDTHILPDWGSRDIRTIERTELQRWVNRKLDAGRIGGGTLSKGSVTHLRKVISAIMDLAEEDGIIDKNPVRKVKVITPKQTSSLIAGPVAQKEVTYTSEQLVRYLDFALRQEKMMGLMMAPIIFMEGWCGLRRGEALGTRRPFITKDNVIQVFWQAQKQKRPWPEKKPIGKRKKKPIWEYFIDIIEVKSTAGRRTIPLPEIGARMLRAVDWWAANVESDSVLFCPNSTGGLQDPDNVNRALESLTQRYNDSLEFNNSLSEAEREELRLPKIGTHGLRRSFATNLAELGCPEEFRNALLGHGKKNMAQEYNKIRELTKLKWLEALHEPLKVLVASDSKPNVAKAE
jgi:integrase